MLFGILVPKSFCKNTWSKLINISPPNKSIAPEKKLRIINVELRLLGTLEYLHSWIGPCIKKFKVNSIYYMQKFMD